MATLLATGTAAAEDEDAKLAAFFRRYLDETMKHAPATATRYGDHRYDHMLDDLSPQARREAVARLQKAAADLPRAASYAKLSRAEQIDYEILAHDLTRSLWLDANTRPYEQDPRVYNEILSDSIFLMLTQSTTAKERNLQNAIARIRQIPRVVEAAKASLKDPPKVWLETGVRQNLGAIHFYEKGIFEVTGESPQGSELQAACRAIIPVLRDYQSFLEKELVSKATGDWRLGKEKFAQKLDLELDAGVTAEQVLRDAEAEAERVEREMVVVARQLWSKYFPKQPLPPDTAEGRRSLVREVVGAVSKEHGKVEDLVQDAKATIARIKQFITDNDILRLPEPDRCKVIEMPEFQRGFSVAYLNPAPPLDPASPSHYAVSPPPKDWDTRRVQTYLQEYNRHMLQVLTIHEAYPGHYVQLEYGNRHPSQIRRVLYSGVFAEGWAVYTEQMMLDQGYGSGDLALRLNQLKFYLRTAVNAILDYKMHCANMTDEEAMQLLVDRAFQSEAEAVGKIVRAKLSSCQLSTYFVGRMAFYSLRRVIQEEQGDKFDLGRYHEAVLDHGTLPVKYLPELVRERLKRPR
ncbi:MAG: DUF885 domain-containing protein [Gemmataceae bacterium]